MPKSLATCDANREKPGMPDMPGKFPAAVVRDYGRLEIADIPAFPPGPYDAVVRILACSTVVC